MDEGLDEGLLREAAECVLRDLDALVGEGIERAAVEDLMTHALALTVKASELAGRPERQRMHGLGLWALIVVLTGPAASAVLHQLDAALGPGL